MKVPSDCSVAMKSGVHSGLLRPKFFVELCVESKELDMKVYRFVLGRGLLLRIRLWLARRECLVMVRKLKKFKHNQAI